MTDGGEVVIMISDIFPRAAAAGGGEAGGLYQSPSAVVSPSNQSSMPTQTKIIKHNQTSRLDSQLDFFYQDLGDSRTFKDKTFNTRSKP